jgi:hypothetical protein
MNIPVMRNCYWRVFLESLLALLITYFNKLSLSRFYIPSVVDAIAEVEQGYADQQTGKKMRTQNSDFS